MVGSYIINSYFFLPVAASNMQCTPINNVAFDIVFNGRHNDNGSKDFVALFNFLFTILLIILGMYLLLRFGTTDYCVGMHSLQVNSYSNVLLLYLGYNSVINI